MKVLVVPTWYPNGEDKLMGIYHKEFTDALNKNGIDTDMLFIDRQRLSAPHKYIFMKKYTVEHEKNYDVYIHKILNLQPISFDLNMKSYTHKFNKALKKYIKENGKPDIIHAMVSVPAGYAACTNEYGIPVIVTEHGSMQKRIYNSKETKKYADYVFKHATITTVSNFMTKETLKHTDYCSVIPNQVNTDIFKNRIKRKYDKTFNLVSTCALREGKGLEYAFEAIKILVDKGYDIHYYIIGDGFKETYYKECAKKSGAIEHITFLGRKNKEEIPKILEDKHALLIASDFETFAIPGIEALASGMPVITTDCFGPTEFIDDKCGVIAKVKDSKSIAASIEKVMKNYSNYDKKYLESVANKYSEESVVKIARKEYEKILSND